MTRPTPERLAEIRARDPAWMHPVHAADRADLLAELDALRVQYAASEQLRRSIEARLERSVEHVRAEERAARSILEAEHRAHCERLTAEVTRYDVAQMRGWAALREAYAIVAGVPLDVAKYERDASTLPELARALVAERDAARERCARVADDREAACVDRQKTAAEAGDVRNEEWFRAKACMAASIARDIRAIGREPSGNPG